MWASVGFGGTIKSFWISVSSTGVSMGFLSVIRSSFAGVYWLSCCNIPGKYRLFGLTLCHNSLV
jgi:hypothetical protein